MDHEQKLNTRYFRDGKFTVYLFMSENGEITNSRALHDLAEKLFWALEYIDVNGSKIRGTDMKYEFVDDVLEFTVNYNHFIELFTQFHCNQISKYFKNLQTIFKILQKFTNKFQNMKCLTIY